mmetsp:Transcript_162621/g.288151  ORF Transcript_162621/g.288151 Transcript_162621/m.288151 type:complete len:206 (-) Transcript_162621:442-1059(-)
MAKGESRGARRVSWGASPALVASMAAAAEATAEAAASAAAAACPVQSPPSMFAKLAMNSSPGSAVFPSAASGADIGDATTVSAKLASLTGSGVSSKMSPGNSTSRACSSCLFDSSFSGANAAKPASLVSASLLPLRMTVAALSNRAAQSGLITLARASMPRSTRLTATFARWVISASMSRKADQVFKSVHCAVHKVPTFPGSSSA